MRARVPKPYLAKLPEPEMAAPTVKVVPALSLNEPAPVSVTERLEPSVKLAVFCNEPPESTKPAVDAPKFASEETETEPAAIVSGPVKVFAPPRTNVPIPFLVKPAPESEIMPESVVVSAEPATSIVGFATVMATLPVRVTFAAAVKPSKPALPAKVTALANVRGAT